MMRHLMKNGGYDKSQWLKDYIEFMTAEPAQHPDTYAESYHRGFFANLKNGKAPDKCGAITHDTPSMGALVTVAPLAFALFKEHSLEHTQNVCCEHVHLTHPDASLLDVVAAYVELLHNLLYALDGQEPQDIAIESAHRTVVASVGKAARAIPGTKLDKLLEKNNADAAIVGRLYSTACYITDSWPAVCYLTAKYHSTPGKAMLVNTNLGGENAHRGSVLGTLVGLSSAHTDQSLFKQLEQQDAIGTEVQMFIDKFGPQ
jgi:ADP-ribosylglycohydrolase